MQFAELDARLIDWKPCGKLGHLLADALFDFRIANVRKDLGDPAANLFHFRFAHAARRDGWAAQADAARFHRWQRVKRNRIFVHGEAGAVQSFFRVGTGDAARVHFDQEQVVVRA